MIRPLIVDRARLQADSPAILAPGREALTYRGLDTLVARIGGRLASSGVTPSDRIALVCSNGPEAATAFLGITAFAACAPLNPGYRASEFEFYLSDLRPRAVVLESGLDSAVREVANAAGIPVWDLAPQAGSAAGVFELAGSAGAAEGSPAVPAPGDIALLLHTSGTTSRPKLVPLTQANLCASARHIAVSLELTVADRSLNVMPLFHVHGLVAAILATLASGGSVVCCPGFVAPKFFDWVEEFRPSWYTAVPAMHQAVLARAQLQREAAARHRFRFIRSCSSALAPSLAEEMEAIFQVPVIEAYGMTEAAHQMASNPLPPGNRKKGSVGLAAGPEFAIVDDAGRLLPRGASGEVAIRGPNVTSGYLENPDANARSFTAGWFRTGDQGHLDADGYLFLTGRLKEIINRGGEKIAPREIDEVLLGHPAVSQAVAFAAPHRVLGETVAAAVVVRPEHVVAERELREFAASRLANFKVPEKILIVDEIPKGPTGKVQRIGLAEKLGIGENRPRSPGKPDPIAPATRAEKQMAALFAETLGIQRAGVHDNFFELGGDSLLAAMLLSGIREAIGRNVPVLEFLEDPTVAGVCRVLERPASAALPDELRLVIRPGNLRPALFCVPGSYGNVMGFFRLAQYLGSEQPLTAFRLPALDSSRDGYSIERLAVRYLAELLEVQPEGPYFLAGACTGGFVAYEMAQQLVARGRTVGLLALMDCYNHAWAGRLGRAEKLAYRAGLLKKRLHYHRRNLWDAGWSGAAGYLGPRWSAFRETTRERLEEWAHSVALRAGLAPPAFLRNPRLAIRHAAAGYAPADYAGRLELFCVDEPRVDAFDYPDMGWQGKAGNGIGMHRISGSHLTMFSEPHVRAIASELLACLDSRCFVR